MGAVMDECGDEERAWGVLRTDEKKVREVRRIADEMWERWKKTQVEGEI